MSARHGSWDSFAQFIRWSQPPSAYAAAPRSREPQPPRVQRDARASQQSARAEDHIAGEKPRDLIRRLLQALFR